MMGYDLVSLVAFQPQARGFMEASQLCGNTSHVGDHRAVGPISGHGTLPLDRWVILSDTQLGLEDISPPLNLWAAQRMNAGWGIANTKMSAAMIERLFVGGKGVEGKRGRLCLILMKSRSSELLKELDIMNWLNSTEPYWVIPWSRLVNTDSVDPWNSRPPTSHMSSLWKSIMSPVEVNSMWGYTFHQKAHKDLLVWFAFTGMIAFCCCFNRSHVWH